MKPTNKIKIDRRAFNERAAGGREREANRFYHRLLKHYYSFYVPPHLRVLELGCGVGDLLAAVNPERGLGIDFSSSVIELAQRRHPQLEFLTADVENYTGQEKFDYILASDLVNDLTDVQALLVRLHNSAHPRTRLVLNFFSHLWRPVLDLAELCGAKSPTPPQNWLATSDMINLLWLADWEVIKQEARILWPQRTPLIEPLFNRWLAPLLQPFCLTVFLIARPRPRPAEDRHYTCTVVIPARNEAGNIEAAVQRTPEMGLGTEILFIEGGSQDNTWETIQQAIQLHPERRIKVIKQTSKGKAGAMREALSQAGGELLFILDADLTVPPEQLPKFYEVARAGRADFVNGVRLVYPMEEAAMQFLNMVANKAFGLIFSWLLGQSIKDTLCGTKVLFRADYDLIVRHRSYFGEFDPFGDFDLLFGAAKLNLRIVDLPIRYQARVYGQTNIQRWRHGWLLLQMVMVAARRFKFLRREWKSD